MPATSTIPLDDLPGALEHADALFAFSVHGLGGSKIAANKSLRGIMASEVAPQQQQQQKEAPKKGWLSSLNTAVVGERQEVVTLMLTLSASEETSITPAAGGAGMPGMPAPPALARRSSGDRPLSGVPARSAMLLASGRPNTPTVFYQSEHRTFGQQPVSPAVVSRSTSPLGFPDGGGEGGMGGGKQRPMTMSEEGIVHFSIPARVPGDRGSGTNGGGDGEGGEETMVVYVVELWQVVNRSRRALWGSLTLTWDNLMAVPVSPRKCGVFSGLQSERYPSAFLAVRRVCPPLPRPLSMSPRGVSNPVAEKFNPMVTFFTAIRRVTDGASSEEDADWLGGTSGFGAGGSGSGDSGGGGGGGGCGSSLTASAEEWELVVCQELAVEGKYTFKIPLQFLFPVHNSLKHASLAWRARARKERHRQGLFSADEEAFAHGMVVVHVSVSRARGLGPIAAAAAAAAATAGAPQSTQLLAGGADAGGGATSNNPGQSSLVRQASVGAGGREGLPAAGGGRGGLGGLGIEGAKVSSSMRAFGGRMKGMGVKAVAMARIASQASPAAHLRLGAVSSEEKILRQANFFVKVVYGPPSLSTNSTSDDDDSLSGGDGSSGLAGPGEAERVVGVTNTEYGSVEPAWGTNANLNACPYNAPRAKHQVSGATRLDVVSDIAADLGGAGGSSTTVGTQGEASSGASPTPSSLAFTFYVPAKHLEAVDGGGGSLRLHLCQNMFSLKAGIVDAPVGYVTIPLCGDAASTVHSPEWRDVEAYNDLSVGGGSLSGGVSGDLLSEGEPRQDPPQVLVGVSIQARNSSSARSGSPDQRPLAFSDASWTLGDGPAAYGSMLGDLTGGTKTGGGGGGTAAASAAVASAMARRISLGSGEWTKVVEDSDSDEDVADEGTAAAAAAAASTTSMQQHLPGLSENLLSKTVSVRDCYGWMDLIGGPSRVLDTAALVDLFALVHYPLTWVESHAKGISDQVDRLARILEVYTQRVSEGGNFRSSLLKKEPLLQYVATNLHIQVWSIRDPATGKDRSYDFVTTGAPAAHALGHVGGGLVTLQEKLQALGMKVLELQGSRKECKERGGVQAVTELEGITDNLRTALLEYEVLGGKVSIRRACVVSQAISIAATSFCAKLEMMARGTLDVASDRTTGGCGSYDELAERWVSTGFLLGFEGLLSIHGKEHGMVEDTVSALDMLADYNFKVVPATLVGTDTPPLGTGNPSPVADDPFELEIGVEGNTIQCIVGDACLPRLPRALWDSSSSSSSSSSTDGGGGGGRAVRIVPVLFTQGIDIQQSMTHAARDAREKAAFQADINSQNLARLNRYCHRVCPVKAPTATATTGPAGSNAAGGGVATSSPGSIPPLLSGGMPPLPRPRGSAVGLDDLLGLGEMDISGGGTAVREGEGGGGPGASVTGAMGQQQTSVGASVPEWMHPALSELETAVRDDKVAHKNTAILLEAQVAVRRLCGGRVTFCKSGKDRTAMSITLEEALLLAETTSQQSPPRDREFGVEGPAGAVAAAAAVSGGWRAAERSGALADANVLRAHGARLLVAEKNIGRPLYSFNALQRQFIPELYQPPPQTIQDVITSALNRDS